MRLFLCEKPSQGRDIAKIVGATKRGNGCLIGQGITVTWCVGHLLETAPPEAYDTAYKKWTLEHLPITPKHWKTTVKPQTKDQFKVVKELLAKTTELVIATDADREGEMIARELVDYCGYKGKIRRLWLSALNDASIRKALSELKSGDITLPMYYSALTRSRSDWLMGINLSRLFTLLGRQAGYDGVLSVGRVQTPTLSLVVHRDLEIANFVAKPFWSIEIMLNATGTESTNFTAHWLPPEYATDEAGRCINQAIAQTAVNKLQQTPTAQVISIETERVKEVQPLVFDLGTLQEVCSRKFGFGAQETLDIAQSLYETHKATTYPRSDCGYLPESMFAEVSTVLNALVNTDPTISSIVSKLDISIRSRVWNDKKITAHHGIIPTLEVTNLAAMSEKEQAVYKLIRSHYLAQFMPVHEYDRTVAVLSCADEHLKATGKQIIVLGWHSVLKEITNGEDSKETKTQVLPQLAQGSSCHIIGSKLNSLKTTPPNPYTEGELIKAMKGIAKLVTDPRLKQKLKETTGIGTEATRAGIIKGLLQRGYLVTKGRSVRATDAAVSLIAAVPPSIIDPGMTALWEQALESIEQGNMSMDTFLTNQTTWLTGITKHYTHTQLTIKPTTTPICPLCQAPMRKRTGSKGAFWACSRYPECKGTQNITAKKKTTKTQNTKKTIN